MTIQHLAARYVGELHNQSRIRGRAHNSANNRNVVLTALRNTDRDDDSYLAALAREWKRLDARAAHDAERVDAQNTRFAQIQAEVRALSTTDEFLFWEHVDDMMPNAPTHQIGGRRYALNGKAVLVDV